MNKKLEVVKCEEDDEFLAELEKTMSSELTGRLNTSHRVNSSDLALPMNRGFKGWSTPQSYSHIRAFRAEVHFISNSRLYCR